ncbi:MAG: SDR family oxidoreductase [Candidatus Omnitrophota bacterium]
MKKILVTGGAGFIGSNIVEELIKKENYDVIVYDNFSTGKEENIKPFLRKIKLIEGDIENSALLKKALKNVDYVLHQAALRSVPKSIDNPINFNNVNVCGTLNVLLASREMGVKKVVFASSSSVYGSVEKLPIKESFYPKPISPYSASKLAAEHYCYVFYKLYNVPTVILRYFNVFGPRQPLETKYAMAIPRFITNMLKNQSPPVHDDGEQSRDFTYVKDIVRANLLALESENADGEIFNVASGKRYTILELVNCLNSLLKRNIKPTFIAHRKGDVRHTHADITKIKNLLGYEPSFDFKEGLSETIQYFEGLK